MNDNGRYLSQRVLDDGQRFEDLRRATYPRPTKAVSLCAVILFTGTILLGPFAPCARALQVATSPNPNSTASSTPGTAAPAPSSIEEPLRQALDQVGTALNQVRIDHWKLSKQWKAQFQNDAASIQRDLATDLPGLFAAMRQAPNAMEPQWAMMHNVNALYNVLVRITTAAELSGGKDDVAILNRATRQLEVARNHASSEMRKTALARDTDLARIKKEVTAPKKGTTIVIDNRSSHRKSTRKATSHRTTH